MFSAEEVLKRLKQQPFYPVRLIVSEGRRYDIFHPDLVLVGKRDLTIGRPAAQNAAIYDQVDRVALVHLVAMEDLPATQTSSTELN